ACTDPVPPARRAEPEGPSAGAGAGCVELPVERAVAPAARRRGRRLLRLGRDCVRRPPPSAPGGPGRQALPGLLERVGAARAPGRTERTLSRRGGRAAEVRQVRLPAVRDSRRG